MQRTRLTALRGKAAPLLGLAALPVLLGLSASQARAQLVINPTFDSSITTDPNAATIENTINSAIQVFETTLTNSNTVNITFQKVDTGLGESSTAVASVNYSDYVAALQKNEQGQSFLNFVPNGSTNPVNGGTTVQTTLADLRTLGFSGYTTASDSTISLNTSITNLSRSGPQDPNKPDLMATVSHEIDEVLGLGSTLDNLANGAPAPGSSQSIGTLDLFRYDQNGNRSFTTDANAASFLSVDGGKTFVVQFNQDAAGDFHDWYSPGGQTPRVQDAFATNGAQENLGPAEFTALEVAGYNLAAAPEPSQTAALGLGVLGLAGLAFKARRRKSAA